MYQLNCHLHHDSGKVDNVSEKMVESADNWASLFGWMVNVHCQENDVELRPVSISLCGEIMSVWSAESQIFVDVEE